MDKKIKILVIPSDHSGCGYFRSVQPHVYLDENYKDLFEVDITYELNSQSNLSNFFKQYDIVHIHKKLDDKCELIKLIKECNCKVIIDVDDYWDLGNDHPLSLSSKIENWKQPIIEHIKLADAVTTTTEIFKKEILKYNKNVFVIPNAINPNEEQFIPKPTFSDKLRFGIICGSSHLKDIEILTNISKQLSKDVLNKIQFVLCGFDTNGTKTIFNKDTKEKTVLNIEPQESVWYKYEKIITDNYNIVSNQHKEFLLKFLKNVEYNDLNESYRRCWTKNINQYATHYNNIDVLLVPLKENKFNQMKSQLKVIEAGFFHKAIIAQNFGPYQIDLVSAIEKGGILNENGNSLLVDSNKNHKQWAKFITKLVDDKKLLNLLQENLYNTVKDKYSLSEVSKLRINAYLNILNIK